MKEVRCTHKHLTSTVTVKYVVMDGIKKEILEELSLENNDGFRFFFEKRLQKFHCKIPPSKNVVCNVD